jgi:hypothetical protein
MVKQILLLILLTLVLPINAISQSSDVSVRGNVGLCGRVAEIKDLPKNYSTGVDAAYDALLAAGDNVVPCLIEKVTDTTIMHDPRCPIISQGTTVGDVAYFVLIDIIKIGFVELLPADVQEKYKTEGVYAYHEHIEIEGARKRLQAKLREWYRKKHPVN